MPERTRYSEVFTDVVEWTYRNWQTYRRIIGIFFPKSFFNLAMCSVNEPHLNPQTIRNLDGFTEMNDHLENGGWCKRLLLGTKPLPVL